MQYIITITLATIIASFFGNKAIINYETPNQNDKVFEASGLASHANIFDRTGKETFLKSARPVCESAHGVMGKLVQIEVVEEKRFNPYSGNNDIKIKWKVPIEYSGAAIIPCKIGQKNRYIITSETSAINRYDGSNVCNITTGKINCIMTQKEAISLIDLDEEANEVQNSVTGERESIFNDVNIIKSLPK